MYLINTLDGTNQFLLLCSGLSSFKGEFAMAHVIFKTDPLNQL